MDKTQWAILRYRDERKNVFVAYILYIFLGFLLQLHRFYAGNKFIALFYLLCPMLAYFLFLDPVKFNTGISFLAIWFLAGFIDLFYIPVMVRRSNHRILEKIEEEPAF